MKSFLHRLGAKILGILSGFDRIRLRGTLPRLADVRSFSRFLAAERVPLKEFAGYAEKRTRQPRKALEEKAAEAGRPVEYLAGYTNKEALVQQRRRRDGVAPGGLIAAFSTLESCTSYDLFHNPKTRTIDLRRRPRKCLHFGLVQNARCQGNTFLDGRPRYFG